VPRPNLHVRDPAVRHIGRLYLPVFLGLLVSTVQVVVDRNLAWRAETDALGAMRYATTLVQSVLGLVAAAISLAALPLLATHFANRDEDQFNATLVHAVRMVSVLIIPAVIVLACLAGPVVTLLFQHGETTADDAHRISVVLLAYLPGTLFAAYDQILIYLFYARRSTWIPVLVGVAAVGAYFATAFLLVDRYGAVGLAIANSVQFISHTIILMVIARDRVRTVAGQAYIAVLVALAASGVAGAVALGVSQAVERVLSGFVAEVAAVVVPLAIAAGVYCIWVLAAGVPEARSLANRVLALRRVDRAAAT
jgi:putative peptidoglycan lipid II flippase